ncbi:MAG: hypothetical protein ABR582_02605 [Gemmatimonadaceae bacterium]
MKVSRFIVAAMIVGSAVSSLPAAAQCSGSDSCSTTNTASVTVGALVKLEMDASTTTLTPPTVSDLAAGYVADVGPSFVVHANQDWTMSIKAAASNPTNWSYVGSKSGVKPIGDLTWATDAGGSFAALTSSNATVASDAASTDDTAVSLFFRTVYSSDYSAAKNRPGVYSLPVVFTLSAP